MKSEFVALGDPATSGILVRISGQTPESAPAAITVAIPTHNRRELVLAAIESARRQTRPPARILVIADGCSDGTQEAVAGLGDPRVELLDLPKGSGKGYENRNRALERVGGGVISWLADDDLYLPDHLERISEQFETGETDLVQSMACVVAPDSSLTRLGTDWRIPYYRRLLMKGRNRTPASAVSHRADLALEAGGWDDAAVVRGDMQLWRRMLRAGARTTMLQVPTVLHFQAAHRDQPYPVRVRQNNDFLTRLSDSRELGLLRAEMSLSIGRGAARDEAWMRRLLLGSPHLRDRIRLLARLRAARRAARD